MSDKTIPAARCPICRKPTVSDYRPFCSKRCADIDLGHWFRGDYAIPGDPVDPADLPPGADGSGEDGENK
ncbi:MULTISPECIES: DNA gyrase inhibitor YacG [Hyphobacterium]|uniref:DNA gyrase inhibitor YacG n=1 Tax=Hyphobacterium vulgare TaxID=1736751 RepID=A0ABV7A0R3_9PROT